MGKLEMKDSAWRLLLNLDDFNWYHARQRYPIYDRREILEELAKVENRSRYVVLETNELFEYTFWDGQSWYDEFIDFDHDKYG